MKSKILSLLLLLMYLPGFSLSLFNNSMNLKQISTKYFTIIFPESSSNTVKRLVSFADMEYERLAGMFEMRYIEKLTVVVTPDVELVNGMFGFFPYNTIILYDFLDDASLLPFYDYFYDLFLHELTHAVSLNLRNGFWHFLRRVFGTYISPHNWQVPYWMIEGVTVSMESYDGDGRSNDPRSKALLAQHLLEGKFQKIYHVAQMRPYPKKGNLHYIYGGLFNTYLQKNYGWEKYKMLWYNNNRLIIPYTFWFSFRRIYGEAPSDLWEKFKENFSLDSIENPSVRLIEKGIFSDMKSDGEKIYYSDSKNKRLRVFDPDKNKKITLLDQAEDFSIDAKNKLLFIKEIEYPYKTYRSVTKVFDIKKRLFKKEIYPKMSKFSFDSNGNMVGIEALLHSTELISISSNVKETLLSGNEYLFFDSPIFLDDKIAFLLILSNDRRIAILDREKGIEVYKFKDVWVDEIYKYEDKIMFTFYYKDKVSLSRLGFLDIEKGELLLQDKNFFGGINKPVILGNNLFYIKRLFEYDEIVFLEDFRAKIKFVTNSVEKEEFSYPEKENNYPETLLADTKGYNPLPYLIPSFWIPFAFPISTEGDIITGLYTGSADPISENSYSFYFNLIGDPFRSDSVKQCGFEWDNSSLPLDISLGAGGEYYLGTNYLTLSGTISKSWMFQNGKSAIQSYLGINSESANFENWENLVFIGTGYYYNSLYKMPFLPYTFSIFGRIGYEIEKSTLYYDGNLNYNSGWFFTSIKYGVANRERYYLGKNIPFWGDYFSLFDQNKLSIWYVSHQEGLFLRLDADLGVGLFPVYINYFGLSSGYRGVFVGEEYFSTIFVGIYPGTILFYAVPFNPGIEINYFIERGRWLFNYSLSMNF
ncbi:MAG: hypothetical protein ACP5QT_03870 [Brevinematia bacterium]